MWRGSISARIQAERRDRTGKSLTARRRLKRDCVSHNKETATAETAVLVWYRRHSLSLGARRTTTALVRYSPLRSKTALKSKNTIPVEVKLQEGVSI
jgi:hypothetical protein